VRQARALGARSPMEFKLNLEPPNRRPDVHTDLSLADARARGGQLASVARARGGVLAGQARSAGGVALGRARVAGRNRYAQVKAFKQRWHRWLYSEPGKTNFWLLISNVLYIAVSLTVLILTLIIMHEHVDDFKRNEFTQHKNADGTVKQYPPCGMPTPDSMYLLQAIGAIPAAGWDGASLEPDYKNWMRKVDRAMCSRIVPGVEVPVYYVGIDDCTDGSLYNGYDVSHAEELLALGFLMEDEQITPTKVDINDVAAIEAKLGLFETRACLEKKKLAVGTTPELLPFYTKQQSKAYGDLKTRVARAYLAAMPAFSRYHHERDGCQAGEQGEPFMDPFDSMCKHSCHIRTELREAYNDQERMYETGTFPASSTFTKQLYRLLALSLAGYYDRYHNNGACFINKVDPDTGLRDNAMDFCGDSMKSIATGDVETNTNQQAVDIYAAQDATIAADEKCAVLGVPPPAPPSPAVDRNGANIANDKLSSQVCAATLQYGLFEQGRLFGIPDVLGSFVVDNRVDRSLHFIGKWIYDAMYVKPRKKAGDILADPKSKLELYIAYRLSSTSIWAILVANVAGYMLIRAAAPMGVYILKFIGVTSNVKQKWAGRTGEFEPIKLVRPQLGWPLYLAQFVNLLVIYWIFWIDPATQSHYYVTTECDDWAGLGVQVPSGAFGTTWGKRRYGRFGEHLIGILLVFTFLFVIFQQFIGRAMVNPELVKDATTIKMGKTARLDKVALIMIAFALVVQILFVSQSIVSGDDWYQAIKASDNDHSMLETFSKDVLMSVWAAFWTSASISWYRQKWAIDTLKAPFQYGWMATSLLLLWMPVFQSAALLDDEIDVAFSDGKGTSDTPRLVIYILIYAFSAIWTVVLLIRLRAVYNAIPDKTTSAQSIASSDKVSAKKQQMKAAIAAAEAEKAEEERMGMLDFITSAPAERPMFNLQGMVVPPATAPMRPQRKTDAVYMPLLPSQQQ
jgi:hypothetical protein